MLQQQQEKECPLLQPPAVRQEHLTSVLVELSNRAYFATFLHGAGRQLPRGAGGLWAWMEVGFSSIRNIHSHCHFTFNEDSVFVEPQLITKFYIHPI